MILPKMLSMSEMILLKPISRVKSFSMLDRNRNRSSLTLQLGVG